MGDNIMKIYKFSEADYDVFEFSDQTHPRIRLQPIYFENGLSPRPNIFARRAVVDRLMKALNFLPNQYGFHIWDVYRPRLVQAEVFAWMRQKIERQSPHLSSQTIDAETRKYASMPSKVGDQYCPPHLSGGAIDLTLYDTISGENVEMGTPFDDCSDRAHLAYFKRKNQLSPREVKIRDNRQLLCSVLEKHGFVSYEYEWWHYDIGNIFWSKKLNYPPAFGPLFGDKDWPE